MTDPAQAGDEFLARVHRGAVLRLTLDASTLNDPDIDKRSKYAIVLSALLPDEHVWFALCTSKTDYFDKNPQLRNDVLRWCPVNTDGAARRSRWSIAPRCIPCPPQSCGSSSRLANSRSQATFGQRISRESTPSRRPHGCCPPTRSAGLFRGTRQASEFFARSPRGQCEPQTQRCRGDRSSRHTHHQLGKY